MPARVKVSAKRARAITRMARDIARHEVALICVNERYDYWQVRVLGVRSPVMDRAEAQAWAEFASAALERVLAKTFG